MRCIDTHCHYNLEPLYSGMPSHFRLKPNDPILDRNWQQHFETAHDQGVLAGIVVGADLENSKRAIEIHNTEPRILASVGLHPDIIDTKAAEFLKTNPHATVTELQNDLFSMIDHLLTELSTLARTSEVVAIGEIGCDYYYFGDDQAINQVLRTAQTHLFQLQLRLAQDLNLPVIVHTRDKAEQAYYDVLNHITQAKFERHFVLHCASGPLDYIQAALAIGAYLGFDGNLTYKNAQSLHQILEQTPADRVLIETDAPYLPPVPFRGQICEPWMVVKVAEYVCAAKGVIDQQLLINTAQFFGPSIAALIADQTS